MEDDLQRRNLQTGAASSRGELLATCEGLPLSDADRAVVVALSSDPYYLAYLAAYQDAPFAFPRIRELAASVFYGSGEPGSVDLH